MTLWQNSVLRNGHFSDEPEPPSVHVQTKIEILPKDPNIGVDSDCSSVEYLCKIWQTPPEKTNWYLSNN